jgi:hypothetical protein
MAMAEIESEVLAARPATASARVRPLRAMLGSVADLLLPPALHRLPRQDRQPRAALWRLLERYRLHRASSLCAARRATPLRCGRALPVGGGNRRSASLRPRAGCGALFRNHARVDPKLQISGPARGAALVRPVAGMRRTRAARRRRALGPGTALPLQALVAALQPIGHARACGRCAHRTPRRLLRPSARAADGEPGGAHGSAEAAERCRRLQGRSSGTRPWKEDCCYRRCDHHWCDGERLREDSEARRGGRGGCLGAGKSSIRRHSCSSLTAG